MKTYAKTILVFCLLAVVTFVATQEFLDRYSSRLFSIDNDLDNLVVGLRPTTSAAGPMVTLSDEIEIVAPRSMRTSESKIVTVAVRLVAIGHFDDDYFSAVNPQSDLSAGSVISTDPPELTLIKSFNDEYEIDISSDSLSISPADYVSKRSFEEPSSENYLSIPPLAWQWTVSADKPGDRLITIRGLNQYRSRAFLRNWHVPDGAEFLTQGVLTIPVRILTPSGLTARQDDMLVVASTVISIVAAILGLAVWKSTARVLQSRRKPKPAHDTSGSKLILPGDSRFNDPDDG